MNYKTLILLCLSTTTVVLAANSTLPPNQDSSLLASSTASKTSHISLASDSIKPRPNLKNPEDLPHRNYDPEETDFPHQKE